MYWLTDKIKWLPLFQHHSYSYTHSQADLWNGKLLGRQVTTVSITAAKTGWSSQLQPASHPAPYFTCDPTGFPSLFLAQVLPSPLSLSTAKPSSGQILLPVPTFVGSSSRQGWKRMGGEKHGREWGWKWVAPMGARSGVNPQPKHCSII